MSLLVNRLSSNITKLLSNNILNNAPESVPIRHHVGYIPAQGRIHPWDTEESRVQRQVRFIPSYQDDGEELQILLLLSNSN